ncbi:MAG: hypothetical protein BroJett011_13180 [Chloroflexota bacterium]|nr:MAG: hypothetical protein BroJett011_13180 [Chloroflexota bacterium]
MKQGLLFIIILSLLGLMTACNTSVARPETDSSQPTTATFATQSNDEQSVTVEVTPLNLSTGAASLDFTVVFDTHSVQLNFDPAAISVLRDDAGREYPVLAWEENASGSGHHKSGLLRFKAPEQATKFVEVIVRDVADVPERVFRWDLSGE